eukprot:SAG22_NODE_145_length_17656_cov_33.457367_7_plen_220_part_00
MLAGSGRTCTWPSGAAAAEIWNEKRADEKRAETDEQEDGRRIANGSRGRYSGFYPVDYLHSDEQYMHKLIEMQSGALGIKPDYTVLENKPTVYARGKNLSLAAADNRSFGRQLILLLREDLSTAGAGGALSASSSASPSSASPASENPKVFDRRNLQLPERIQLDGKPLTVRSAAGSRVTVEPPVLNVEQAVKVGAHKAFGNMKTKELRKLLETFKIGA